VACGIAGYSLAVSVVSVVSVVSRVRKELLQDKKLLQQTEKIMYCVLNGDAQLKCDLVFGSL